MALYARSSRSRSVSVRACALEMAARTPVAAATVGVERNGRSRCCMVVLLQGWRTPEEHQRESVKEQKASAVERPACAGQAAPVLDTYSTTLPWRVGSV